MQNFGYCISKTNTLETLIIDESGINGENYPIYIQCWESKSLRHVNLNWNLIGDIGLISISTFMKKSSEIESIELENCGRINMGFSNLIIMNQNDINR